MSDIVERLLGPPTLFPEAREQAADEIERLRADHEKFATACMVKIGQLADDNAKLLAALDQALDMVEAFASGSGFSSSGRAEFEQLRALTQQGKE